MRDVVIVFARAPRLGTVKRRLARGIGTRAALRFHAASLRWLLHGVARQGRFMPVLALTPDRARVRVPTGIGRISQGRGDLGQRMLAAFRTFPRARVALIGCDIPDMEILDLHAAFRALGTADAAFGPAEDGGYWLVAMTPRRPARPFHNVRWSGADALADTLANFRHHRVARLRSLKDIDTPEDYRCWRAGTESR